MCLTRGIQYYYENITPFQAAIALSLIFLYVLYLILRDMDLPPGPNGLPLFGYWPFLNAETCHLQLKELSKKYGDVFSLRITGKLFIHLGSLKAIKEAHITKTECFGRRFSDESIFCFLFSEGVTFVNGEPWKVIRKFFVSKFKEYGMNAVKENAASSIYDALKQFVEELSDTKGRPILITDMITMKCMGILRRILFNDEGITMAELQELNELYGEMMKGMTSTNSLLTGKLAKYLIFPCMPCSWKLKKCNKQIQSILFDVINRHKSQYNESQVVDIIDCYLKERDERRKKGDPAAAYLTELLKLVITDKTQVNFLTLYDKLQNQLLALEFLRETQDKISRMLLPLIESALPADLIKIWENQRNTSAETDKALVSSLNQFVNDGVLSVSVFIGNFLMRLVEYPDEQEKIYQEILEVVGQERLPTLEDKSKLPYTNAFIYEVTRLTDFFPMFPSLECTKETALHGYKIPEGSVTLLNMYAANRNPEDFENPDEFNPSRYMATEDKPRAELPILFGIGKRACIGEAFSMIQTFLFLTTIVQNFRLSLPEGSQGSFMYSSQERPKIYVYPRSEKTH